jgi:hypothetical protein
LIKCFPNKFYVIDNDGHEGKTILNAKSTLPVQSNSDELAYKNIYPNIDFGIKQFTGTIKTHYLINQNEFNELPSNIEFVVFSEELLLPNGATARYTKDKNGEINGIEVLQNNKVLFNYGLPIYYEQRHEQKYSKQFKGNLAFLQNGNNLVLNLKIPLSWLNNSQTTYPVIIDPTVTLNPTNATWWTGNVDEDSQNNGNTAEILVGFEDGGLGNDQYHGWAKFNLASIPDCADISSANVNLYQNGWVDGNGNNACSWNMGWANTDPVPDPNGTIFTAIQGQEVYCRWNVWGNCSGACYDFNEACCGWENMLMDVQAFRNRVETTNF